MSEPLFKTDCPSCGAPVHAHSATAVTLVCGYCNSLLVRHDSSVADTGRDSALLEDFSPLQIGTTGRFGQRGFTLVGRLQARYDAGVWNEWYAWFDDGSSGWLSEAGDQYVFTLPVSDVPANLPPIADVVPGHTDLYYRDKRFVAADVRSITLSRAAAQGELPFELPETLHHQVADWRCEQLFMTTDYGSNPPEVFVGRGVRLDELALGNLRSEQQIADTAGRLKGTRQADSCPSCGSAVTWINGLTPTVICPSCHSDLDTGGGKAELLQANSMRAAQQQALSLPLGSQGQINGKSYTVIGVVYKDELEPEAAFDAVYRKPLNPVAVGWWREYLLYGPQAGFLWLVETGEGEWSVSETLNQWPRLANQSLHPQGHSKLYDYGGRVAYAAGAFYWHIRQGDLNYYTDYRAGSGKLCAERDRFEMAWSKSTPVSYQQVGQWFNLPAPAVSQYTAKMRPDGPSTDLAWLLINLFIIINVPAWLAMDGGSLLISLVVSWSVFWFLYWRGGAGKSDEEDDE